MHFVRCWKSQRKRRKWNTRLGELLIVIFVWYSISNQATILEFNSNLSRTSKNLVKSLVKLKISRRCFFCNSAVCIHLLSTVSDILQNYVNTPWKFQQPVLLFSHETIKQIWTICFWSLVSDFLFHTSRSTPSRNYLPSPFS